MQKDAKMSADIAKESFGIKKNMRKIAIFVSGKIAFVSGRLKVRLNLSREVLLWLNVVFAVRVLILETQ